MTARGRKARGGGAGWTWRRALALALCLLVLALGVRPHAVEASSEPGATVTASSDISGSAADPDGGPSAHCAHCGCVFVGIECPDGPGLPPRRSLPRFATGARAVPDAASLPESPPPRT